MFKALVDGMTILINYLYQLTVSLGIPSYALAIILLTVLVKLVLYPLTRIQMHSMIALQQLAPEIKKIQEKYKDKAMAQQKIMELYKERRVNPMAGCLLMLIQLPILIALYRALWGFEYVEIAHASFFWVPNLSRPDPFYILPVLAAVSTFFQSKLTMPASNTGGAAPGAEQSQKIMLYFLPLFIGWISIGLPAGLALYWVVFNIMGIIQQYFINKQLPGVKAAATEEPATEEVKDVEEKPREQRKKRRRSH
ncbi:MAG: YidC/Oxa1 family membrane protein insertase [Bacillota bacterium]